MHTHTACYQPQRQQASTPTCCAQIALVSSSSSHTRQHTHRGRHVTAILLEDFPRLGLIEAHLNQLSHHLLWRCRPPRRRGRASAALNPRRITAHRAVKASVQSGEPTCIGSSDLTCGSGALRIGLGRGAASALGVPGLLPYGPRQGSLGSWQAPLAAGNGAGCCARLGIGLACRDGHIGMVDRQHHE